MSYNCLYAEKVSTIGKSYIEPMCEMLSMFAQWPLDVSQKLPMVYLPLHFSAFVMRNIFRKSKVGKMLKL